MPLYPPPPSSTPTPPGGSDTEVQFNDSGSFGGVPVATYDGADLFLDGPTISEDFNNGVKIYNTNGLDYAIAFRSTTPNTQTGYYIIPNGSNANYPTFFNFFGTDFLTDPVNFEGFQFLSHGSANTYHSVCSFAAGTGMVRALNITALNDAGVAPHLIIGTDGGVSIGTGTQAGDNNLLVQGTIAGSNLSGTNTGDNPGVTSIATTSPITGGTITGTGTIAFDNTVDLGLTHPQNITVNDSLNSVPQDVLVLTHTTTGTPQNGLGVAVQFYSESSTPSIEEQGEIDTVWTDVTHATRTAVMMLRVTNNGIIGTQLRIFGSGGISVNNASDPGAGIVNANSGYRVANAATSGNVLRGNGANFVSAQLNYSDLTGTASIDTTADYNWTGDHTFASELTIAQTPNGDFTIADGFSMIVPSLYNLPTTTALTINGTGILMVA